MEGEHPEPEDQLAPPVRPPVSVIIPFAGGTRELDRLVESLDTLERREDDELIVVDNRAAGRGGAAHPIPGKIVLHRASAIASPAFARNQGARVASGEWLVFIDADTRPSPRLIDEYFSPPPGPQTAVLAGGIIDVATDRGLVARHDVARHRMSQKMTLRREGLPYAQTANCAVRRSAFKEVGGFEEQARAGEDADLCFRLQRAGWSLEERAAAWVEHEARRTLRACLGQNLLHGSGARWLNERYPGEFPTPGPRWLLVRTLRMLRQSLAALTAGDRQESAFVLLDLAEVSARDLGRLRSNSPARRG